MNLYLLVEGEKTEPKLYQSWLKYLLPKYSQVFHYKDVYKHNFYLFKGGGIPHIYKHTVNAIKDINQVNKYDYLIVCIDSEELTSKQRITELKKYLEEKDTQLNENCELIIIIQTVCIETWFLGNQKVFKRNPTGDKFILYSKFYNIEKNDPELMPCYFDFETKAQFHEAYLREMFKEHNIRYKKSQAKDVLQKYYLEELEKRILKTPNHLKSLQKFLDFCKDLKNKN